MTPIAIRKINEGKKGAMLTIRHGKTSETRHCKRIGEELYQGYFLDSEKQNLYNAQLLSEQLSRQIQTLARSLNKTPVKVEPYAPDYTTKYTLADEPDKLYYAAFEDEIKRARAILLKQREIVSSLETIQQPAASSVLAEMPS